MNLWGAVEVIVTRPAAESSLQKIITLIKDAQQRKAPAQQFTDRFGTYYTYIVLGLSFVMFSCGGSRSVARRSNPPSSCTVRFTAP